jgi:uncharacterized membrane protein
MTLFGRLHPLLVHFPIGLVLIAAVAELLATMAGLSLWRVIAIANTRVGGIFAIGAAIAGWVLASAPGTEPSITLSWHRWLGSATAIGAALAALATVAVERESQTGLWIYRLTLFGAAATVAITGHLGGILVWGADFLRP